MATNFKLTLEIKKKGTDEHVCQKIDGQRFGQTNTVKLNVNTVYDVKVTLRPVMQLLKMAIHGESHTVEVLEGKDDDDKRVFCTTYNSGGHDHSKKGARKEVPFVFELENGLIVRSQLQCKFYKEKEVEHSKWGKPLNSVEYECQVSEGHTYVIVTKERYL